MCLEILVGVYLYAEFHTRNQLEMSIPLGKRDEHVLPLFSEGRMVGSIRGSVR